MTPKRVKSSAPALIAGAADHKFRKRHGAKAARRQSDEMKYQPTQFTTEDFNEFFYQAMHSGQIKLPFSKIEKTY